MPPCTNRIYGELGSVPAGAYAYIALISYKIIDTVGDRDTFKIRGKIMIQNFYRFLAPFAPGLMKRPYQFTAFGINADYRHCVGFVAPYLAANISELQVTLLGIGRFALPGFKAFKV